MPSAALTGFVLASALCCVSCIHQVEHPSPFASSPPAVTAAMSRHVQNAVDAGDGDLQLRTLRKRLASNANDLDARVLLARLYSRRGLPDLALEHYRLAAAQFPDAIVVTLALAKTLREMGEADGALKISSDYLAKYPNANGRWELLSLKGILDDERGQFAEAEAAYRAAIAIEPGRSALHNNLGYNLLLQGQPESAAVEFRRAIEIEPQSQIAHNNLGTALAYQSRGGEALSEWQHSAEPAVAHNNLAAVLIKQGRYADARAELQTALGFRRDFPAALANLRLLAAADGGPAAIPAPASHVNSSKRPTRNNSSSGASTILADDASTKGKN